MAAALNGAGLAGLRFVAIEFTPTESKFKGEKCEGVYVMLTDRKAFRPARSGVTIAWELNRLFPGRFELVKVERLLQNQDAARAIENAGEAGEIEAVWRDSLAKFKEMRRTYLLYEE